jgi:actin related protein 2/3 complex subunit 3
VLFRNFEINGPADRMLIYGTLFISECLGKVKPTMNAREAEKVDAGSSCRILSWSYN